MNISVKLNKFNLIYYFTLQLEQTNINYVAENRKVGVVRAEDAASLPWSKIELPSSNRV